MTSYSELSQEQIITKLNDNSTSIEELEKIMFFLAEKDTEAKQETLDIETRLKKQDIDPQIGIGLTSMHNAVDNMSKSSGEYAKNEEERSVKWDLLRKDYMPAINEMCEIYQARIQLLFSVKEDLVDIADKLIPKVELDQTKDPWMEIKRFNKEVEDTEVEFNKEIEKVSNFTKSYHNMPEYKELTIKLYAVKEKISLMEKEFENN